MSDYKIVYLIVERGVEPNRQVFWRPAGNAFVCQDGSLNLKLDMYPGLNFNIRDPKSNGGRDDAELTPASEEAGKRDRAEVVSFPNLRNGHNTPSQKTVSKRPSSPPVVTKPAGASDDDIPF